MPRLASAVLRDDHWRVVVAPDYGGALLACEYDGEPVLTPVRQPLGRRRIARCYFPMVPFANRIENARFVFDERPVKLEADAAGVPHALHGHGWQRRWDLCERKRERCTMTYRHEGAAGWPWRYRAWQTIDLRGARLSLRLRVRNDGDATMPCGLGFHPFFPRACAARLRVDAGLVWDGSAPQFPRSTTRPPPHLDLAEERPVALCRGLDHCYENWDRRASIRWRGGSLRLSVEGCAATARVVVYTPRRASYFCVEPVTHAVNAFNLDDPTGAGLWRLAPRRSREIHMSLRCFPAR